jgi:hypothetical protein
MFRKAEDVWQNIYHSGNIYLFKMTTAFRTKPECGDSGKLGG